MIFKKSKKLLISIPVSCIILIGLIIVGCDTGTAPPMEDGTTTQDTTPPTIESVTPLDNATDVEPDTEVTVTASEAIDPATVTPDTVLVELNGISISGYYEVDTSSYQLDEAGTKVTFSPPGGLALYTVYKITITTGVKDLAGNALEEDYIWSFRIRDGSWGSAVELHSVTGSPNNEKVKDPQVAFDYFGKANVVWSYYAGLSGPNYTYYTAYSRFDASQKQATSWTEAANIQSQFLDIGYPYTDTSLYPEIASNMTGTSVAAWKGKISSGKIYGSVFSSDSWAGDESISPEHVSLNYSYPQVAVDPDGNALAVWRAYDGGYYSYASFYDNETGNWGNPEIIDDGVWVNTDDLYPKVAFDGVEKANVVWSSLDTSNYAFTLSSRYGSWSPAEQRSSSNTMTWYDRKPRIASNMNGVSFAVWRTGNSGYSYIYADRFESDAWADNDILISDSGYILPNYPQIAVDTAGNAIAVWEQSGNIYANLFKAGSTWPGWESPIQLTDESGNNVPQVAIDGRGNAIVVWLKEIESGNYQAYSRRFQAGSEWSASEFSTQEPISAEHVKLTQLTYEKYGVQIGVGPNGRVIAVWSSDSDDTIFANVFE